MKILIVILMVGILIVSGTLCCTYLHDDNIDPLEDWGALIAAASVIIITSIIVALLILNL